MRPLSGASRRTMQRATVVFPEPLSPINASVSPSAIDNETSVTAFTVSRLCGTGKVLTRLSTVRRDNGEPPCVVTPRPVVRADHIRSGIFLDAALRRVGAAGLVRAVVRGRLNEGDRGGLLAVQHLFPLQGEGVEQCLRVGVAGLCVDLRKRTELDETAPEHHADPCAVIGDDAEVPTDQDG